MFNIKAFFSSYGYDLSPAFSHAANSLIRYETFTLNVEKKISTNVTLTTWEGMKP